MNRTLQEEMNRIRRAIDTVRMPAMPGEYDIHGEIARALEAAGISCCHEFSLAPRSRIDFLVGSVGVEIKKGRPAASALRSQLARYLKSDALDGMIVVVQQGLNMPDTIGGKPVMLVSLNRLWGVALP